jgi:hypothetical protein
MPKIKLLFSSYTVLPYLVQYESREREVMPTVLASMKEIVS